MKKQLPFSARIDRLLFFLFLFIPLSFVSAQKVDFSDSLSTRDYDYLYKQILNAEDEKIRRLYMDAFLKNAKRENNQEELLNAYRNFVHYSPYEVKIKYADSMVFFTEKSKNPNLISNAYLSRGIAHYGLKNYKSSLDDYLKAYDYSLREDDYYLQYKIKYNVGQIKYYLGFYPDAVNLFQECIAFFKDENSRAYLNSIHSLALCYNRMGNIGLSMEAIDLGLKEGKRISDSSMDSYFLHLTGINEVARENYALAIENIQKALPDIERHGDFANTTVGCFYLGKAYWKTGNRKKAVDYFLEVDRAFTSRNYTRLDLREAYEMLIDYHKSKKDIPSQIHYTRRLASVDSLLRENQQHLGINMQKGYDTKALHRTVESKNEEIQKGKRMYTILLGVSLSMLIIAMGILYRFRMQQRINKEKFEAFMKRGKSEIRSKIDSNSDGLNPEVLKTVSLQLERFEQSKKFLAPDLTLAKLAAAFNSNTKYLSRTIHQVKQKSFTDYINDLKIEHLIELLKSDRKFRKYTNAAMAEEVGFSSVQRFIKAFKANTELTPSIFIQELNKNSKTT